MTPTNTTITIEPYQGTPSQPLKAWLEQRVPREVSVLANTAPADWLLIIPGDGVSIGHRDRVVSDGRIYEVHGPPTIRRKPGGGGHHIEVLLRDWPGAVLTEATADQCRVERLPDDGSGTFDPVTGAVTQDAPTVLYEGGCLIQPEDRQSRPANLVMDTVQISRYRVAVPIEQTDPATDDHVVVTASGDPLLAGTTLRVVDTQRASFNPWRVLVCELVQG